MATLACLFSCIRLRSPSRHHTHALCALFSTPLGPLSSARVRTAPHLCSFLPLHILNVAIIHLVSFTDDSYIAATYFVFYPSLRLSNMWWQSILFLCRPPSSLHNFPPRVVEVGCCCAGASAVIVDENLGC